MPSTNFDTEIISPESALSDDIFLDVETLRNIPYNMKLGLISKINNTREGSE